MQLILSMAWMGIVWPLFAGRLYWNAVQMISYFGFVYFYKMNDMMCKQMLESRWERFRLFLQKCCFP